MRPDAVVTPCSFTAECSGLPGRTTLRHPGSLLYEDAVGSVFRSSRPDYIETTGLRQYPTRSLPGVFRSSRPDYIETCVDQHLMVAYTPVFRSSRPDYIETWQNPLARFKKGIVFRSSRPDYIETWRDGNGPNAGQKVFRSSRPDYIETLSACSTRWSSLTECSGLPGRTTLRRPIPSGRRPR